MGPKPRERRPAVASPSNARKTSPTAHETPLMDKAVDLARYAEEHGWSARIDRAEENVNTVTVSHEDEAIVIRFIDNKVDPINHPRYRVGSRDRQIKNVKTAKRQIAAQSENDRPLRKKLAIQRYKYSTPDVAASEEFDDDEIPLYQPNIDDALSDEEVMDLVAGQTIRWRSSLAHCMIEVQVLPRHYCAVGLEAAEGKECREHGAVIREHRMIGVEHPANGRRVLKFATVNGPMRAVYIDKIEVVR